MSWARLLLVRSLTPRVKEASSEERQPSGRKRSSRRGEHRTCTGVTSLAHSRVRLELGSGCDRVVHDGALGLRPAAVGEGHVGGRAPREQGRRGAPGIELGARGIRCERSARGSERRARAQSPRASADEVGFPAPDTQPVARAATAASASAWRTRTVAASRRISLIPRATRGSPLRRLAHGAGGSKW
jgi:hypothetical protein